jgi:hypothetical protein
MSLNEDLAEYRRLIQDLRDGSRSDADYNRFCEVLRGRYEDLGGEDAEWLREHLCRDEVDRDGNCFVGTVLKVVRELPGSFFEPLLHAAVYEIDPSINRYFVEPAVRIFGLQPVAERLLKYLNEGTNFEKGGAVNAFYWARVASREDTNSFADLWQRIRDKFLAEFVANDDTQVRRCLISLLRTQEYDYSPEVRHLVAMAINIARNHGDDYIRHRIEVQLGNERIFRAKPDRTR